MYGTLILKYSFITWSKWSTQNGGTKSCDGGRGWGKIWRRNKKFRENWGEIE